MQLSSYKHHYQYQMVTDDYNRVLFCYSVTYKKAAKKKVQNSEEKVSTPNQSARILHRESLLSAITGSPAPPTSSLGVWAA